MVKIFLVTLAAIVGVIVAAFVLVGRERSWELIAGSPDRGRAYDFSTGRRSPTPNDALACSPDLCERPDFEITPRNEPPAAAIELLANRLTAIDPLARRLDDGSDPVRARFATYSPLMRFPDVIYLEATTLPDGRTGLMAYARAQLGKGDFGKNRARLENLFSGN